MNAPSTITNTRNKGVKILSNIISYLFHPLFIPTFFFLFLLYFFPYEFAGISPFKIKLKVIAVFWMTAFFPAFAVFLLWKLKFSNSIYLRTQKERIIPYFITMFFYWWMHYLSKNQTDQPIILQSFYLGVFYTTIVGVVINNFIKISLHTIASSGLATAIILTCIYYQTPLAWVVALALLLNGIIASARLLVSNHTVVEVYSGMALGSIAQIAAFFIADI